MNRTAASATLHCLTGCAVGEVIGMILTTLGHMSAAPSVAVSVGLAFLFGYTFSLLPLFRGGLSFKKAVSIALAADTLSIAVMEITDNGFVLAVPGAIHAGLNTMLFWWSLLVSLLVAYICAFPVNRFLIARGKGHALAHRYHEPRN
ncbi:MAG: DUF4396 domain-containing protein [Candidatus Saccharimonadales bacterium]